MFNFVSKGFNPVGNAGSTSRLSDDYRKHGGTCGYYFTGASDPLAALTVTVTVSLALKTLSDAVSRRT